MSNSIKTKLFNDRTAFINYFLENDSKESREFVVTSEKLAYWYCRHIDHDSGLYKMIHSDAYRFLYLYWVRPPYDVCHSIIAAMDPRWVSALNFNSSVEREPSPDSWGILSVSNSLMCNSIMAVEHSLPIPILTFSDKHGFVSLVDLVSDTYGDNYQEIMDELST